MAHPIQEAIENNRILVLVFFIESLFKAALHVPMAHLSLRDILMLSLWSEWVKGQDKMVHLLPLRNKWIKALEQAQMTPQQQVCPACDGNVSMTSPWQAICERGHSWSKYSK
jgi:hypothetical protein